MHRNRASNGTIVQRRPARAAALIHSSRNVTKRKIFADANDFFGQLRRKSGSNGNGVARTGKRFHPSHDEIGRRLRPIRRRATRWRVITVRRRTNKKGRRPAPPLPFVRLACQAVAARTAAAIVSA
ncbi:hypothetical protein AB4851_29185 [Burkholderia sp. 22PA0099]|uniref:hypothetical protein n=1 Tax=Burkholderia sp. 22PA0099 TaxID=3237372 RepID=UPI0039C0A8C2